ncbi:MAG: D-aminoacyl-tRNA deacylase [Planctomycetota bacterium]
MRALLQRVTRASVAVDGEAVGAIDEGLLILLGVGEGDTDAELDTLASKIVNLRLFRDERGRFDRSLLDIAGEALVVSQFTLYADCRKGRRPSFTGAAGPELAEPMCNRFADRLRELGVPRVETGRFAADMRVELCNDGPVTIWLDTAEL